MRAGEAAAAAASDLRETLEAWGVSSQSPFIGSKKSASLRLMVRAILSGCKRRKKERESVGVCVCVSTKGVGKWVGRKNGLYLHVFGGSAPSLSRQQVPQTVVAAAAAADLQLAEK